MSPPLGLSPCVRGYQRFGKVAEDDCGSIPVCTGLPSPSTCLSSVPRVYPRVYGATLMYSSISLGLMGLSPCVRGYPRGVDHGAKLLGSIPVCTGLPRSTSASQTSGRVYPRVYGATSWSGRPCCPAGGLSPCVRGYLERGFHPAPRPGSIPVCTGLPIVGVSEALLHGVYPRVYGATVRIVLWMVLSAGLSPCVRGYQLRARAPRVAHGSIPVCTGLPTALRRPAPMTGVYPRVYGATHARGTPSDPGPGLSPCVRGYHSERGPCRSQEGSIPVCTGLPDVSPAGLLRARVYPRVYGATMGTTGTIVTDTGLSPCVRGYRRDSNRRPLVYGSIPVCTGLPRKMRQSPERGRVYPRVYGATPEPGQGAGADLGLSPCVRGYLGGRKGLVLEEGSIPVCTGLPLLPGQVPRRS